MSAYYNENDRNAAACSAAYDAERRAQCAIIRDEIPLPVVRAALNRRMRRE